MKRGILYASDLPFLWREYPSRLYPFLIQLLQIFEIVYPFTPSQHIPGAQPVVNTSSPSSAVNVPGGAGGGGGAGAGGGNASSPPHSGPLSSLAVFTSSPSGAISANSPSASAQASSPLGDRKQTIAGAEHSPSLLSWIVPCMLPEDPPTYSLLWPKVFNTKTRNTQYVSKY